MDFRFPGADVLDRQREKATLFIRLIVGFHLVYGTQDNVFSWERMLEFEHFLAERGVPFPLVGAIVSVYAQFLSGLLFIAGAATRWAGVVMIINFIAALVIAHRGLPYPANFPPLMMLAAACFFLVHGAGDVSVDSFLARRRARASADVPRRE
jgi:putative oxidoreductase